MFQTENKCRKNYNIVKLNNLFKKCGLKNVNKQKNLKIYCI